MKKYVFLAVAALAVAATILFVDPFTPLEEKMLVEVTPDAQGCTEEFPIGLWITNRSRNTVTDIAVEVIVREIGYSRDLERERFDTDKIIKPGETFSMCIARPETVRLPPSIRAASRLPGSKDTYADFASNELEYSAEVILASSD